jgi:hypothetical protein
VFQQAEQVLAVTVLRERLGQRFQLGQQTRRPWRFSIVSM